MIPLVFWSLISQKELKSRLEFLSDIDKGELLALRLEECVDPTCIDQLHNRGKSKSRDEALRDFLIENRFELKPVIDKISTFDIKSLCATRGSDPRLRYMKRLIDGYSPGHPLCRFLPMPLRLSVNDMFLLPPSDAFYDIIEDSTILSLGACVGRHTHFDQGNAEEVPSCQGIHLGERLFAFERPQPVGSRAVHPRVIFDMKRGGVCSMGDYSPSTFRLFPGIKSAIIVDRDELVFYRPLYEPLVLFTSENLRIKQISKSASGGYNVLFLARRLYRVITVSLDGGLLAETVVGSLGTDRVKLDGDLVEICDWSYGNVRVTMLGMDAMGYGRYPQLIDEDFCLVASEAGGSLSFALLLAQRSRLIRFFTCFCNTHREAISLRSDPLARICTVLYEGEDATLAGAGAWDDIESLVLGKPHGMVSLNAMLCEMLRS